jgi:sensor c-di-GMP phosphodiesterase-like protein
MEVDGSLMPFRRHRPLTIFVLALLGTLLGTAGGFWLGRITLMRSAIGSLSDYAGDLIGHAEEYSHELTAIRKAFNPSQYPYCSQQEIFEMRAIAFRSLQVKDVGRIHDGKLDCSAYLGQLNPPTDLPASEMTVTGETRVSSNVPLQIAGSDRGTILESRGVGVVLSPTAFDHWGRPHMRYMVALVDRDSSRMARIAGVDLGVDYSWVINKGRTRLADQLLISRCSLTSPVCVVSAEATADLLSGTSSILIEYAVMGSVAGFGLSFVIAFAWLQQMSLSQQLRRAVRRDQLWLVYQPVLDLGTRKCVGAEALLRWANEDGEAIPPDFFIRAAEDKGFLGEITALVIRRATRELNATLRANPTFTLSINIAASDFEGEALFSLLQQHVESAGIAPAQIALELTERSTADITVLRQAIERLHSQGYKVHIDDFGTGYSSFSYLHELAVDAIKIDRSFTRTIGTDAVTASVLPQMLSIAESLNLDIIVEGVETESQVQYLDSSGKPMQVQGWFFSKPVNAAELRLLIPAVNRSAATPS